MKPEVMDEMKEQLIKEIQYSKQYFNRSTDCLEETHSQHVPVKGMFTVAQQVAHVAQTIDWFLDGVKSEKGFDMDFAKLEKDLAPVKSLQTARDWLEKSYRALESYIEKTPMEKLAEPISAGQLMVGMPRHGIVPSISDHTAHHRGALTVYSRTLGLTPNMPYM